MEYLFGIQSVTDDHTPAAKAAKVDESKQEQPKKQKQGKKQEGAKQPKQKDGKQQAKKETKPAKPSLLDGYESPFLKPYTRAIHEFLLKSAGVDTLKPEQIDVVEEPRNSDYGDFAVPVPRLNKYLPKDKMIKGNPAKIAEQWATAFTASDLITGAKADGIYINFTVNKAPIAGQLLPIVFAEGAKFGTCDIGKKKNVIVEYSSPNIAKPFHAGHLRSTIIGNFLKNIHNAVGYNAVGINYLGDWGKQYGLLAVGFEKYGSEEQLKENPIRHLFHVYVKINEAMANEPEINDQARAYFKRMEQGDQEALDMWKKFRDLSIHEYKKMYARLNVEFDVYSGESLYGERMEVEFQKMKKKDIIQESRGAQIVDLKPYKLNVAIIKKEDGTTLYITRDIAAASSRFDEYQFDKMFYVVAAQQNLHFQQLFKMLDMMDYKWVDNCTHINFGMVKGMSTRKGNVVFLEDILNESKSKMLEVMKSNEEKFKEIEDPEQVADIVGISAVLIQDLSARRIKDYDFNWDRMTAFQGDTGPYLQFAHARMSSIERKAVASGLKVDPKVDLTPLTKSKEALNLIMVISKFPELVLKSCDTLEPCTLVGYCLQLSHAISTANEVLWVMGKPKEEAEPNLLMYHCARVTLGNGLRLLGLKPLERM